MAGTLAQPKLVCEKSRDDWNGTVTESYTIDAGYYGGPLPADPAKQPPAWVVQYMKPNDFVNANQLLSLSDKITENVLANCKSGKDKINDCMSGVNIYAQMFIVQSATPLQRVRLRAEKTADGWKISEYDFNRFEFVISV